MKLLISLRGVENPFTLHQGRAVVQQQSGKELAHVEIKASDLMVDILNRILVGGAVITEIASEKDGSDSDQLPSLLWLAAGKPAEEEQVISKFSFDPVVGLDKERVIFSKR